MALIMVLSPFFPLPLLKIMMKVRFIFSSPKFENLKGGAGAKCSLVERVDRKKAKEQREKNLSYLVNKSDTLISNLK